MKTGQRYGGGFGLVDADDLNCTLGEVDLITLIVVALCLGKLDKHCILKQLVHLVGYNWNLTQFLVRVITEVSQLI